MPRVNTTKRLCVSANGPTDSPCSAESAFTLLTPKWIAVTKAAELVAGQHIYGHGLDTGLVMYTVPPNRLAMLVSLSYSDPDSDAVTSAVRDKFGRLYFMSYLSKRLERFPLLDENDQLVVWGSEQFETQSVLSSVIEFDKTLPCGSFYHIIRFSGTEPADVSAEYQIPGGHSAILCPNLLPIGSDGQEAAETILFGHDNIYDIIEFNIECVINSTTFTRKSFPTVETGFVVADQWPPFTAFKGGDTLRIKHVKDPDEFGSGLKTGYAALLVKRN